MRKTSGLLPWCALTDSCDAMASRHILQTAKKDEEGKNSNVKQDVKLNREKKQ